MLPPNGELDTSNSSGSQQSSTSPWLESDLPVHSNHDNLLHGYPIGQQPVTGQSSSLNNAWIGILNHPDLLNMTAQQLQSLVANSIDSDILSQFPYEYLEQDWQRSLAYHQPFFEQKPSRRPSEMEDRSTNTSVEFSKPDFVSHSSTESHTSLSRLFSKENESIRSSISSQVLNEDSHIDQMTNPNAHHETEESRDRRRTQNRIAQRLYRKRKEQALQDRDEEINSLKLQLERERKLNQTLLRILELFRDSISAQSGRLQQNKEILSGGTKDHESNPEALHIDDLLLKLRTDTSDDVSPSSE